MRHFHSTSDFSSATKSRFYDDKRSTEGSSLLPEISPYFTECPSSPSEMSSPRVTCVDPSLSSGLSSFFSHSFLRLDIVFIRGSIFLWTTQDPDGGCPPLSGSSRQMALMLGTCGGGPFSLSCPLEHPPILLFPPTYPK
ncbi:hypothetical protein TNIN_146171 [Trichonephila inaurata madagascariensis]|uniref:Uncharacterized protein n=1 Tax=Trichonephila inaurata madagascariensis TaxID=2747483 RepID=A0A8X6YTH4_9ARAC|nr:hypothetical protein TNIN_146171 [Trichonephila inaurata madagascariensis]